MTKKAMKLLLITQTKSAIWFLCIYPFVIALLLVIFYFANNNDFDWIGISAIYAPKLYLLVMGIVYPLITTELFVSRGLTRKQYFWAFTGAISILSLVLLLPTIIAEILLGTITLMSLIMNLVQLPLFFLLGWTAVVGFQFQRWYTAFMGMLCAIVSFQTINLIDVLFHLPEVVQLGASLLIIVIQIMILPHIISRIPIKC